MASAPAAHTTERVKGGAEGARWLVFAWGVAIALALGVRLWNALVGPVLHGYDGWAHITYVLFLDTFHALPWADQGWSFFHPPLYYLVGFGMAQFGSAEFLARGLALFSSLASLGIAWLVARIAASESPTASLGAFCALLGASWALLGAAWASWASLGAILRFQSEFCSILIPKRP